MLYLVRHGKAAGGRLSELGRQQAARLATVLGDRPVNRIMCSPVQRCRDTMAPLALATGVEVETHEHLGEDADIEPVWALLESLGEHVVVCSHAPVIESVLNRVHRRGGEVVADVWSCPPASVWRLEPGMTRVVLDQPG